ncbi:MAG: hypothetical protein ABI354_03415 [Candidatus Saccharimonadales bacterium]
MALFKRSKGVVPDMPPELTQYYKDEKRERVGVAWLLAIVTMLITLAIIVGLFVGGRWIYRKARSGNNPVPATTQKAKDKNAVSKPTDDKDKSSEVTSTDTPENPDKDKKTSDTSASTPQPESSTPSSESKDQATTNQNNQAAAQSQSDKLANTGPGDTVALFLAVVAIGYTTHQFLLPNKKQ